MRTATRRALAGSLSVGALTSFLLLSDSRPTHGQVAQAVEVAPAAPGDGKDKKDKNAPLEVMIFPSDRDAKNMIKAVNDYLAEFKNKKAPWDKICQAAQQVLDAKSDSFYEAKTEDGKVQRISAKAEANRLIGRFPDDGKQFYQLTFGGTADGLLNDAVNKGYDRTGLADVSQRYFHTKAGAQATLLLAALHLDRGNYVEAAYSFERLLDRKDAEDLFSPLITFKAIAALQRAGQSPEKVKTLTAQLEKKFPRDGLKIGRRTYSLDDLKEELAKNPETLFGKVGDAYVTMRLGNASHTAIGDGGVPFLDPIFSKSMTAGADELTADGVNWIQQNLTDVVKGLKPGSDELPISAFFPVSSQNLLYVRTYDGIHAYVTKDGFSNHGKPAKAGDLYWIASVKGGLVKVMSGESDAKSRFTQYRDQLRQKTILYENGLVGAMTHDGQNLYAVDDNALPPPPQIYDPNMGGFVQPGGNMVSSGGDVEKNFTNGNHLMAVNMVTGSLAWRIGNVRDVPNLTEEEEDKTDNPLLLMANAFFVGPPLPINGKLYVLFEKNGRMRLACLDPLKVKHYPLPKPVDHPSNKAPELVWSQRLGEPNTKLPTDAVRRTQCSFLTYSEGVMICPTNAGAVVAVDVMSRSLLWARSYRSIKQPTAEDMNRGRRFGGFNPNAAGVGGGASVLAPDHFRSTAPIVSNGRLVFSAFDAESIDCLDLRTGDLLWSQKRESGDLYVGGVVGDKVLVVNKEGVRAINLVGKARDKAAPTGKEDVVVAWRVNPGVTAGHGVVSKGGTYFLPVSRTPDQKQPAICSIDVAKGKVAATAYYRKKAEADGPPPLLGNLIFHEGQLISQTPFDVSIFPQTGLKKQEMDALLKANPRDPVGLVARGEISLDNGEVAAAIADFKEAAKNNPPEDAARRLRDKLYLAYTELLRKDIASGEAFLDEYQDLMKVKVDAEDPKVKQQQIDEGLRRKRVYLELMAEGRRKQKKPSLALPFYLEITTLGDNKQLVTFSEEGNGQIRPDVWARGQIAAMIEETTDPVERAALEGAVTKEWQAAQTAADPKAVADFVQRFGDYFAVGREAQLLLAEKQIAAGSDDDTRQAQALLMKVWATAPDRTLAARAVEALARLMTRRGMMDDAVALYARLGEEFGDVAVRDGKTGADFLSDLLTDKRLLPYLEPTRVPTPDRVKVKTTPGYASNVVNGISVEPDGAEDNPFYKRHRLMLVQNNSGDGTWTLQVTDRSSGQDKGKYTRLRFYAPNGAPTGRVAQAHGQLLLVHTGLMVHCFDVAERKQLWEFNPLGDTKLDQNRYYDGTQTPEMETFIPLGADGRLGIGRATVLESNIACILHKDGLTGLDPVTGAKLWTRTNVSPSSVIFGDAKHIFVVEKSADNRGNRGRVFRATDGKPVEGVPDFAALLTGDGFQRFVGRNLLVTEVRDKKRVLRLHDTLTGQDLWKKEYAAEADVFKSYVPDLTAAIEPDGKFEVLAVKTGKQVFTSRVDQANVAAHVKDVQKPALLGDAERFYLVLNKNANPNPNRYYGWYLKFVDVQGAIYCFDKATAKRLWYTDKLFQGQQLLVDRFAEVPALVAGTSMQSDDGTGQYVYRVAIVDKVNGRLRYKQDLNQNSYFYAISTDPKNATARLVRNDMYWDILPDTGPAADGKAVAATTAPKPAGVTGTVQPQAVPVPLPAAP